MGKKQGLHGFKAFLVVVASGVLAGLLVVWGISSSVRAFVSLMSGNSGDSVANVEGHIPTRGPVTYLEPGSFDLCQSVENIQAFNSVYQERLDDGSNFVDTALENPDLSVREISNECSWKVLIGGMKSAELTLVYESKVGGESVVFEDIVGDVSRLVENIYGQGDIDGIPGGGRYFYGRSGDDEVFVSVGVVKNTSFSLLFRGDWNPEDSFEVECRTLVRQMIPDIRERLDRVVPD